MRIAEVAPPWVAVPPPGYGGIELVVSLLADGLTAQGHDVTLFATGDSRTEAALESVIDPAPGTAAIGSFEVDTLHQLAVYLDPGRFDLIHQHTEAGGLVAAPGAGVPVVLTIHWEFTPGRQRLYEALADRIWFVAISEEQRRHAPGLRYAGVVYNGIDVSRYPYREEKEDFVLFLGRAAQEKGTSAAVRAAREAGVPIVLAVKRASEVEQQHWSEEVEPLLPPDTEVHGEIGFEEKVDLLGRARAVLFPIDWDEPFGLVMTEAMACGTPVIGTPRGAAPEVVTDGETGFLVPVDRYPEEAAGALDRLGQIDPAACRARVQERFSVEAMVAGYEACFERVLAAGV